MISQPTAPRSGVGARATPPQWKTHLCCLTTLTSTSFTPETTKRASIRFQTASCSHFERGGSARLGVDRVIFGSDWPHIEGMPEPLDYLADLEKFSADEVRKIMRENVMELNERRPL